MDEGQGQGQGQIDGSVVTRKPPRSPPLAFEKTPNDALWAQMDVEPIPVPSVPYMTTAWSPEMELQTQIDKQAEALSLQHLAFVAERESWQLERERLYRRIAALEALLKTPSGQSPAKSPVMSPNNGSTSLKGSSSLTIVADADVPVPDTKQPSQSLLKRESAPARIDLSTITKATSVDMVCETAVGTTISEAEPDLDLPASPPATRNALSPPPLANRHLAGHTPLKAPRLDGISPTLSTFSDRLTDTPTRTNTQMNEVMDADHIDEDLALKGPLHMPELPSNPGLENFTMDMLDAKLKDVMEHPEDNKPVVCRFSSPDIPVLNTDGANERQSISGESHSMSVPEITKDAAVSDDLDNGGIRLRTKRMSNFGAPMGQLGSWK